MLHMASGNKYPMNPIACLATAWSNLLGRFLVGVGLGAAELGGATLVGLGGDTQAKEETLKHVVQNALMTTPTAKANPRYASVIVYVHDNPTTRHTHKKMMSAPMTMEATSTMAKPKPK